MSAEDMSAEMTMDSWRPTASGKEGLMYRGGRVVKFHVYVSVMVLPYTSFTPGPIFTVYVVE